MYRANNAVIMQTEQLGQIEVLEEELRSSKAKMVEMEQKMTEQDRVITQLVGDNLDHLQDNMRLTAHITSSNERLSQMEHRLGQVGSVVMGFLEGRMEGLMEETSKLSGSECHCYDFLVCLIGKDLLFSNFLNLYFFTWD